MSFHRDKIVKFDYNPVLNAQIDYLNAVGATDSTTLRTLDFTPSDTNTVYVAKTGSDSTGTGTAANPVLTIKKAESLITAVKCNIVILDDGVYEEESLAFDTNCRNIAAAIGKKPTIKPVSALVGFTADNYYHDTPVPLFMTEDITYSNIMGGGTSGAHLSNGNTVIVFHNGAGSGVVNAKILNNIGVAIANIQLRTYANDSKKIIRVCSLASGHFVLASGIWDGSSYTNIHIAVYNNSGIAVYTNYFSNIRANRGVAVCALNGYTDRFVVVMSGLDTQGGTHYMIMKYDGTIITNDTQISTNRCENNSLNVVADPDGGFVVMYKIYGSTGYWHHINSSGVVVHSGTVIGGELYSNAVVFGNKIVFVANNSSNNIYLVEYDLTSHAVTKSPSIITTLSSSAQPSIVRLSNGVFCITAGQTPGRLFHVTPDWDLISSVETYDNIEIGEVSGDALGLNNRFELVYDSTNERVFCFYNQLNTFDLYLTIKGGYLIDWWSFTDSIALNGIIFGNSNKRIKRYIQIAGNSAILKWCNLINVSRGDYRDGDNYLLYAVTSFATTNQINNCKILQNDAGFKITSDNVSVQNSQFYKQLLGAAVHVIGAGAGIIVNHNDFLYNYVSVKLEDNNGLEVLKNNIFYTSLLYSIQAETVVTYTNSVENAVSFNATAGAQVIRSHPHYINDGYVSLEVMDLVLKSRELGYRFESPAMRLGDDLKNAGSVEFEIADGSRTWDTIYVMKPNIKKGYNPVGAIETIYKDGDVDTYRDSSTEVLKLEWDSLTEADFQKLLTLYFCSNNLVQITLDPESEPGVYGTYRLVYDKINASPKNWQFDDIGKNDFDLTFKRAFNEGL
jgi:hypothetical protein